MLKSLELFGFKSFADRTKFDFSPGITAVVGPNGSGKSNVVDGIKWLLGDQSPRSLRGKEMTDVIFNGAAGRKGSQLAEATLTFDNASGFLPIDAPEVQIGRRLWRSGDSEYLINKTPARLKDVRDLLMGTGAGSAAYNIIEQGRVDQILQANAASRRVIFEEAAGISRYKARKVDAARKLERVDQNLLRLRDMVDELETRVTALRGQAARAAQFREVSEELRGLWQGLAADDFRHLTRELTTLDGEVAGTESRLALTAGRQQDLEGQLALLDTEIAALDDRLRGAERRAASNRETIAGHEATIRHQAARKRELEGEIVRLRRQRSVVAARARETAGELARMRAQLAALEADFDSRRAEFERSAAQRQAGLGDIESARKAVEEVRQRLLDHMRVVSAAESRAATIGVQLDGLQASADRVAAARGELDRRIAHSRAEHDRHRAARETLKTGYEDAVARQQSLQADGAALRETGDRARAALAGLRERRSAASAKLGVLEEFDRRHEGVGVGARGILERAATLDYPPWSRIHGTVADLLEADLEQAGLLEAALGPRADLIVIEEFDALVEYVAGASSRIAGRVGFISCAPADPDPAIDAVPQVPEADTAPPLPDFTGVAGVVTRADRLAKLASDPAGGGNPSLAGLPAALLADTWIVETLAVALGLSRTKGNRCRFVTLQGERLDPDGTLTVGTPQPESATLSRKSELRALRNEIVSLDRRVEDEERRLRELAELSARSEGEHARAGDAVQEAAARVNRQAAELERCAEEQARLERERVARDADLDRLAAERRRVEAEGDAARGELLRAEADLKSLREALGAAETEAARAEQRLHAAEEQTRDGQLDAAKHEERLNALRVACRRLEQDHGQRLQQQDEAERRYDAVKGKLREITLHILNTSAALAERVLHGEGLGRDVEVLVDERTELRGRRARVLHEESALRQQRRELSDRQHQRDMRRRDLRHQLETLRQRIGDEYQLSLEEVAAAGASAVRSYVEQTRRSAGGDSPAPPAAADAEAESALFLQIRGELDDRVQRLRRKLRTMGTVDTESLSDLDELERRYALQSAQLQDLAEAKAALEEIVRRINAESRRLFLETFEEVRGHFQQLFRKAFGGGDGDIVLEDPEDVLECGIEIVARPPGKELKSLSLLSGGEKALTAFALLLALFKTRPSPYCLLDEVDAPLDEANVGRLGALLEEFKGSTQFIVITHKKPTMTIADVLYGVTMEQSGVSKRMSVRFEDVNEKGEFVARGALGHAA